MASMSGNEETRILIREITAGDAAAAARLCGELYVACLGSEVVGWIEVGIARHLTAAPRGEIRGMVVSSEHRSRGIGRKLLAAAEAWVAGQGVATMTVRSRTSRDRAHSFYLREGYSAVKTSAVFSKVLGTGLAMDLAID